MLLLLELRDMMNQPFFLLLVLSLNKIIALCWPEDKRHERILEITALADYVIGTDLL